MCGSADGPSGPGLPWRITKFRLDHPDHPDKQDRNKTKPDSNPTRTQTTPDHTDQTVPTPDQTKIKLCGQTGSTGPSNWTHQTWHPRQQPSDSASRGNVGVQGSCNKVTEKNTQVKCPNSNHQAVSETGTCLRAHRVTAGCTDTRKQSAHLTRRTGSRTPRQTNVRPRITVELSNHTAVTARVSSSLRRHRSKCCSDLTVSATPPHLTRTHETCFHKGRSRGAVLENSDSLIALW